MRVVGLAVLAMLSGGCKDAYYLDVPQQIPATKALFEQAPGHQLPFDIFLPNSFTGWQIDQNNQFSYLADCQCYQLLNLDISGQQVDEWGSRFKIASQHWQREFGFSSAYKTIEQAKFGVAEQGSIVRIKQMTYPSDMYFQTAKTKRVNYLHVRFKVTDDGPLKAGLMYTKVSTDILDSW